MSHTRGTMVLLSVTQIEDSVGSGIYVASEHQDDRGRETYSTKSYRDSVLRHARGARREKQPDSPSDVQNCVTCENNGANYRHSALPGTVLDDDSPNSVPYPTMTATTQSQNIVQSADAIMQHASISQEDLDNYLANEYVDSHSSSHNGPSHNEQVDSKPLVNLLSPPGDQENVGSNLGATTSRTLGSQQEQDTLRDLTENCALLSLLPAQQASSADDYNREHHITPIDEEYLPTGVFSTKSSAHESAYISSSGYAASDSNCEHGIVINNNLDMEGDEMIISIFDAENDQARKRSLATIVKRYGVIQNAHGDQQGEWTVVSYKKRNSKATSSTGSSGSGQGSSRRSSRDGTPGGGPNDPGRPGPGHCEFADPTGIVPEGEDYVRSLALSRHLHPPPLLSSPPPPPPPPPPSLLFNSILTHIHPFLTY